MQHLLSIKTPIFLVESKGPCYCPDCSATLTHRDFRNRIMKTEGGKKKFIRIERMKCRTCNRLHTALPDFLVPFKHYAAEIISGVLDGIVTSDDLDDENYPCEVTMMRWHHWMMMNYLQADGQLKSLGYRKLELGIELLEFKGSLLDLLRKTHTRWLEILLVVLYNSGGYLQPF